MAKQEQINEEKYTNERRKRILDDLYNDEPIDFDSLDGELAYIFFLLVAPQDSAGPHLKALARISRLLKDKYFRDILRDCTDEDSVIKIVSEEDEKKALK